jgi:CDP-diacylglycerol--glycerol-3-phosphate 3-phosphatidyltransferase
MNLPNSLTLFRIFLVPLLVVVLLTRFPNREYIGVAIFLSAAFTDWLDGRLARRRGQITALGTWLDPIADKLLVASAFIALVEMQLAPAWMVTIIVGREVAVTGLRNIALLRGFSIDVSELGKAKMAVEVIAVTSLILGETSFTFATLGRWTLWIALVLALLSAVEYFRGFWLRVAAPADRIAVRSPLLGLTDRQKGNVPTHQ